MYTCLHQTLAVCVINLDKKIFEFRCHLSPALNQYATVFFRD